MKKSLRTRFVGAALTLMLALNSLVFSAPSAAAQEISGFTTRTEADGKTSLVNADGTVIADGFSFISDYEGYPYGYYDDGSKVLFDMDGSIIAECSPNQGITPPHDGLYSVYTDGEEGYNAESFLYEYPSRRLIIKTVGRFLLYSAQTNDKIFLRRGSKYAVLDRSGTFLTDFIYDHVIKSFNPNYEPFPHSYAVVVQDGFTKYLDIDLNEINLLDYNGERFITNAYPLMLRNFSGELDGYRVVESGNMYGLYDMNAHKLIIPYELECRFLQTNGKYILFENRERTKKGIMDFSGNVILPLTERGYQLGEGDIVGCEYLDEEGTPRMRYIDLTDMREIYLPETCESNMSFYKATPFDKKAEIAGITLVYSNGTCADLGADDVTKYLNRFWNFSCDRVMAYAPSEPRTGNYFILYNADRSKVCTVGEFGDIVYGAYGKPYENQNGTWQNYIWYKPYIGNAKNALYNTATEIMYDYKGKTRLATDADAATLPTRDVLNLDGASEWAKPEIEKSAALNLLPYDLTNHYGKAITRLEFCILASQLIKTDVDPKADSRLGASSAIQRAIHFRDYSVSFSDCGKDEVLVLAELGIVNGVGDGKFEPDRTITREEAAAILYRLALYRQCGIHEPQNDALYLDSDSISPWASVPVAAMAVYNIMKGVSEHEFSPKGTYTVEQAIATVARMSDYSSSIDYWADEEG